MSEEKRLGLIATETTLGEGERSKVPRQCPLVLLVEIKYMIGIKFIFYGYDSGKAAL
jgi:hypothetical protein